MNAITLPLVPFIIEFINETAINPNITNIYRTIAGTYNQMVVFDENVTTTWSK